MNTQNLTPAQQAFAIINPLLNAADIETYSDDNYYFGNDGFEFPYVYIINAEYNPTTGLIDCTADEYEPDDIDPCHSFELNNCTPEQAAEFIITRTESADSIIGSRPSVYW